MTMSAKKILKAIGARKMNECEFCQPRRDDNEDLIYSELNGECNYFTQIRYKNGEYRLQTVNSFRKINFCPMCGRKLEKG
jgi:hypothetical protein